MKKFLSTLASVSMMSMLLTGCGEANTQTPVETETPVPTAEAVEVADENIHLIYFNDFHGNVAEEVTGKKRNMGMAKMVGFVNEFEASHPNTIVLSGGDNYQGTSESNLTIGKPVTAMMKGMNVVASAVGNHEFDWGADKIAEWAKDGNFDYLAANIEKDGEPVDWAKPYMIQEINGKKIAFIGLAHPNTPTLTKASNIEGLTFTDPIEVAKKWVKFLEDGEAEEGKPDAIVLLTHIDSSQDKETNEITGTAVDLAEQVEDIDLILSAHSHRTVNGIVNDVPIIQASKYGRAIGVVDMVFDENDKPEITCEVFQGKDIKDDLIDDEEQVQVRNDLEEELAPIKNEVLGVATEDISHSRDSKGSNTPLGHWTCEVMAKKTGAQIGIQNGGGLRRALLKGDITMGDMYEIMPFDNYLVTADIKGSDLIKQIDHGINMPETTDGAFSGLIVEYDSSLPYGEQITNITLEDGTPIDPNATYSIVTNDFQFFGGDGYDFSNCTNVDETYVPVRDVLVEAIKEQKELTPDTIDYITDIAK